TSITTWRARCGESRTAGSAGGLWETHPRKLGRRAQGRPICHRPAELSEIDHITSWARNGTTDHHNCHGACKTHNLLKEEPGWHAEPTGNGGMTITTPSGHTYDTAPEPLHDPRPEPEEDVPPF
ncbi:HNH endonuclease, partial [Amycolatopsis sp. cmx-11-12]|uniref:HNH endonuclease n=1 Tax=Amycolatopsis sp. cmx-11-12 TaxID=2785795 RepID=UPI0039180B91